MYKALFLSPMIPSFDLKRTTAFFTSVLDFTIYMDTDAYVILEKDHLTVHLLPAGHNIGQMEFYMEVNDVDQVWSAMKDRIESLKVRAPFNREYGMREIHIEVPATNTLLFIGQELKS